MQLLLGHASIATTERYTAVDDSEARAVMVAVVGDGLSPPRVAEKLRALPGMID